MLFRSQQGEVFCQASLKVCLLSLLLHDNHTNQFIILPQASAAEKNTHNVAKVKYMSLMAPLDHNLQTVMDLRGDNKAYTAICMSEPLIGTYGHMVDSQ